jgi:DNA repair protein RadC
MKQKEKLLRIKELQSEVLQLKESFNNFGTVIRTQKDIIDYFGTISPMDKEVVYVLFLNTKNRIINHEMISEGTIAQSLIYPREIAKKVIEYNAFSIMVLHNHPSGDPTPSEQDKTITKKLVFGLSALDIFVLDHIILGTQGKGYFSFFEEGLIDRYKQSYKYYFDESENIKKEKEEN